MRKQRIFLAMALPTLALLATGPSMTGAPLRAWAAEPASAAAHRPLLIVTSIPPLAMVASQVGGERVAVRSLLAAGADPHTYEPRPSDAAALQDADVVISLGSSMDSWLGDTLRPRDGAAVVKLDETGGAAAADHDDEDGRDPHVWLDPLWVRDHAVEPVRAALVSADPEHADAFTREAAAMTAQLTALDAEIRDALLSAPTRSFLAWHPAWAHFAGRYDLRSAGDVGESEGREPSLKAMIATVEAGRAAGVRAVLVEPQEDDRHARVLADELRVGLVTVDPLGEVAAAAARPDAAPSDPNHDAQDRSSYAGLMRFNAKAFAKALGAGEPPSR